MWLAIDPLLKKEVGSGCYLTTVACLEKVEGEAIKTMKTVE